MRDGGVSDELRVLESVEGEGVRLQECRDRGVDCLLRELCSGSFVQPGADVGLRGGRHVLDLSAWIFGYPEVFGRFVERWRGWLRRRGCCLARI